MVKDRGPEGDGCHADVFKRHQTIQPGVQLIFLPPRPSVRSCVAAIFRSSQPSPPCWRAPWGTSRRLRPSVRLSYFLNKALTALWSASSRSHASFGCLAETDARAGGVLALDSGGFLTADVIAMGVGSSWWVFHGPTHAGQVEIPMTALAASIGKRANKRRSGQRQRTQRCSEGQRLVASTALTPGLR